MQRNLLRQLKRSIGVDSEEALASLLETMRAAADQADPALKGVLEGFGDLLQKVDAGYQQYERDLELRARSLELSSTELNEANEKLRLSLATRDNALRSLRATVRDLDSAAGASEPLDEEDIAELSQRIATLVAEGEQGRRELANQKFALDQHAIVSITDRNGTIVYANDRFCDISGYTLEELLGQNHRLINSGVHTKEFFREMWQTILAGGVWRGEVCNRARDGSCYWVNATIVPLVDESGRPDRFIGIRTDITDRKRMEAQLSEQLHLVEEVLEAIPLPVYLKDENGRYVRLNRAFGDFFQVPCEQFIGRTLYDLLPPEDAEFHAARDRELLADKSMQTYETVVHSRDGKGHDAVYRKAVLTRRDGSVSGLIGVVVDITDRKRAEVEILRAKEAAEAASQSKSDFLANMSHEIRTPMNGIIGMTDLALDTDLNDEQREYLSIVKSSAESLLTIINDILDFSKIEAGKLLVEHISFDLHRVISDTIKPLALRAYEKNLEIVSEILPDVPRHVLGDPGRVRQVLINLIGNAIKFTAKGEIALHTSLECQEDAYARIHIAVRDTGIGIPTDKQGLIFDAFSQADSSTTRRFGGTGLGLSISRRLVELMGGRMWLESTPGEGSTFHFSIQLQLGKRMPALASDSLDINGRHILIVDDNATNRRVLGGILGAWEATTRDVDSGKAALELLRREGSAFDCIILDSQMPEMDGYELAQKLHEEFEKVPPLLMLSSGAVRGDARRCEEVGIAGFFSKPISSEELLAALLRLFSDKQQAPKGEGQQLVTRFSLREAQTSLNVLLVEDHPTNQKLALGLLSRWGHQATLAVDGQEGVDAWGRDRFDVILMDVQMPVMGGIEATRIIRARETEQALPRTPIIAMTAAAMEEDRIACLQAGMDDYISKPIKIRDLQEKLNALCAKADTASPA